jgi:hypothetical protein
MLILLKYPLFTVLGRGKDSFDPDAVKDIHAISSDVKRMMNQSGRPVSNKHDEQVSVWLSVIHALDKPNKCVSHCLASYFSLVYAFSTSYLYNHKKTLLIIADAIKLAPQTEIKHSFNGNPGLQVAPYIVWKVFIRFSFFSFLSHTFRGLAYDNMIQICSL